MHPATITFAILTTLGFAMAEQFIIDIPIGGVLQCIPVEIVWQGGTGPFDLIFTADVTDPLQIYRRLTKSPFLWSANVSSNTRLVMSLLDEANGSEAISGNFSVSDSGNSSCLRDVSSSTSSSSATSDQPSQRSSSQLVASSTTFGDVTITGSLSSSANPTLGSVVTGSSLSSPTHHLSAGAIGGIVAGAIVLLMIPIVILIILHKRRQRQEEESLTTTQPFRSVEQAQMVENTNGPPLTSSHERPSAPITSKFPAVQPDPNPQSSTSTLLRSQSSPTDVSDNDQVNLIVPADTPAGNPPPNSIAEDPEQERTLGSDISMIERVTRAVLQGLPVRRSSTREGDPPRYEE